MVWHYCCLKCAPTHIERLDADRHDFGHSLVNDPQARFGIESTGATSHIVWSRTRLETFTRFLRDLRYFVFKCDVCGRIRRYGYEIYVMGRRTEEEQAALVKEERESFEKRFGKTVPLE